MSGQYPPPGAHGGGYPPPGVPGQYPPPGAPGRYPSGPPGQYPPPGPPGQYPPPGAPGKYPPGAPEQYKPPGAPAQYPPPGAHGGGYPPSGAPGHYPPPGAHAQYPPEAHGQYPPPFAPGQYPSPDAPGQNPPPDAPGQYPPPGAPGQYAPPCPPGQYPPHGAPGQRPPLGGYEQYPAPGGYGQYPQSGGSYPIIGVPEYYPVGPEGQDAVDSDDVDYIRTRHSKNPVSVKFVNRTNKKVKLYGCNEKGKFKKITKLKKDESKDIATYETHPFAAKGRKRRGRAVIDGNVLFFPEKAHGGHVRADITILPKHRNLLSSGSGAPVIVKFSNRTKKTVSIKRIGSNGYAQTIKDLSSKKAWLYNACVGQYFTACQTGNEKEIMELNRGDFYFVKQGNNPRSVKKVLIKERSHCSSSSSSSSDSD